jgi:hypothetical protein
MYSKLCAVKVAGLLLFLFANVITYAQSLAEISKPLVWLKADKFSADKNVWEDISGNHFDAINISPGTPITNGLINFNPAIYFDGNTVFEITAPSKGKTNRLTAVIVYKIEDTALMGIFSCKGNGLLPIDFTTEQTIGDTDLTYNKTFIPYPLLGTVSQSGYSKNTSDSTTKIYIGKTRNTEKNFKGLIAEFLLFNKALSIHELSVLHSYLAIKYGITLYNNSYFENDKKRIWDFDKRYNYSYSVTGIGKKTEWSLYQPQSYNTTLSDSYLSIAFQKNNKYPAASDEIQNNQFLIWGDNGQNFEADSLLGLTNRKWLLQSIGFDSKHKIPTQLNFSIKNLQKAAQFYLVIDKKDDSFSNTDDIRYIKTDSISKGVAWFNNLTWDEDNSGKDYFSFSYGVAARSVCTKCRLFRFRKWELFFKHYGRQIAF